ncbi:hypothetical protein LINPERPRIM_LOCUS20638, partial [Linum perenne]
SKLGGGIILRDDQGRLVLAFASNLGSCSVVRAEIRGIIDGMTLAWDKGIRKLRIQTDMLWLFAFLQNPHIVAINIPIWWIFSRSSRLGIGRSPFTTSTARLTMSRTFCLIRVLNSSLAFQFLLIRGTLLLSGLATIY